MKRGFWIALLALCGNVALANTDVKPDTFTPNLNDKVSLQRGVRTFVNYCLTCHSAAYMRYNRLEDLGLTEAQIKQNLLFAGEKVGETMTVAMRKDDAKQWFGAAPPDLSVVSRSRGADWLYTYLRGFYADPSRPTGWNNTVFDKVGMPHVLYQLQGIQVLKEEPKAEGGKHDGAEAHAAKHLVLATPGSMTEPEYDAMVRDLVNYLVYMGEPAKNVRMQLGLMVLLFLAILLVVSYYLKKNFWKDIH